MKYCCIEHQEMLADLCLYFVDGQVIGIKELHPVCKWWHAQKKGETRESAAELIQFMIKRLDYLKREFREKYARED